MRRFTFLIGLLLVLTACGHKNVQVRTPQVKPVTARELEGLASYYAEPYNGRPTASGEIFDTYRGLTAAHRTLPFNTLVRVKNKVNGREVDVRINDRGPFVDGRVIDLSLRAAREIDMVRAGIVPVKLEILKTANTPTNGSSRQPVYAVQVGAFESPRAAGDLKRKLDRRYRRVTVQSFSAEKTIYRVRIGPERDLDAAQKLATQLRKEDYQPFVVRVN